jgi:hypothetical protein
MENYPERHGTVHDRRVHGAAFIFHLRASQRIVERLSINTLDTPSLK